MSIRAVEVNSLLDSLNPSIEGGKVQKVFEIDPHTIVFQIRIPGETILLLFSATRGVARFQLIEEKSQQPQTPTALTMGARKHLTGRFGPIQQVKNDRIVRWEIGDAILLAEFTNHPFLSILDTEDRVLVHSPNAPARVGTGRVYSGPESEMAVVSDDRFRGDLSAVAFHFREAELVLQIQTLRNALVTGLKQTLKRTKRLKRNLESDLEKCVEASQFQRWATLLQSAYQTYEKGSKVVNVVDYYDPAMIEVAIPVDPSRSLQDNVTRYFHQYKRLTAAFDRVAKRLEEADLKLAEVRETLIAVQGADLNSIAEMTSDAKKRGWLRRAQVRASTKGKKVRLPYRVFRTQSGLAIWVGRGAKNNDILTTRHTKGRDIWMHARDWAGAHVVLKTTLDLVSSEDLIDAAVLTAHFSKGVNDSSVEVSYTEGKFVRKPKGFAPGLVTLSGAKTLVVRPDDPRLKRLLAGE